jgi:hypothetical protein
MLKKTLFITTTLLMLAVMGCKKQDRDFIYLQQQLINSGYTGIYEKPDGQFQKAALGFMGVEDVLAYRNDDYSFAVIKFKSAEDKDLKQRIEPLIALVELYLSEEDRAKLATSLNNLDEKSVQHNNILLVWEKEKPRNAEKLIKKYF